MTANALSFNMVPSPSALCVKKRRGRVSAPYNAPKGAKVPKWRFGVGTASRKQRPVIAKDDARGIVAGRAGDAAAGMGAGTAMVEAF